MKIFHCENCSQILYFENSKCLSCDSALGFLPNLRIISSLVPCEGGKRWQSRAKSTEGQLYKKCANYEVENVCNWMLPAESNQKYCLACSFNLTIPNLDKPKNRTYWYRLEMAKKRLLYALLKLNLPLVNRQEDPNHGLAFQFLEDEKIHFKETKKIMTGHANGIITINIEEADDEARVKMRVKMKEEYRTILGHFRHEIGHYYWTRLIDGTQHIEDFRRLFGDQDKNYTQSLRDYYEYGAPPDWRAHFVTAYASSHPWEDWAETWAHYLHIVDTLETAQAWGLKVRPQVEEQQVLNQQADSGYFFDNPWPDFESIYQNWTWMTCAINSMNRCMGLKDFYPYVLSQKAKDKLQFVDFVIKSSA